MAPPIYVRGLTKSYGDFQAVRGIDFEVRAGEVFGLLGPNGAGKTTTVEILEGLRPRDSGEVFILGFDPGIQSRKLKNRIGVSLQSTNLPEKITVLEALDLFCSLYSHCVAPARLLERLQLEDKARSYYSELSGGQKQRLALALALVNNPQVVFLDEPTAGLDPQARHRIHALIQGLRQEERTVLLTTHYIEEAERLCDRVAIMDSGEIIALGTPGEIQSRTLGHSLIQIHCEEPLPEVLPAAWEEADKVVIGPDRRELMIYSRKPARTLVDVVKWADQQGVELADLHLKRPSLEDVFIELTGRSLRE